MRNYFAALAALLLIAAAVFLPGELAQWNDTALLDEPHILRQEEEREGFAEQMQLTVGEKLLLLRSGKLSKVPLEEAYLTDEGTEMAFHYAISAGGVVEFYVEPYLGASAAVGLDPGELIAASSTAFATDKTLEMLDSPGVDRPPGERPVGAAKAPVHRGHALPLGQPGNGGGH